MMALLSDTDRYGALAKGLHWLMAIAFAGMIFFGFQMSDMGLDETLLGMGKFEAYQLHKSFGFTLLVLALMRLVLRFSGPRPPLPDNLKTWERVAAHITHYGLYVIMIATPIAGLIMSSASPLNIPTVIFGVLELPRIVPASEETFELFYEIHELCAKLMMGLVGLHILAALKHHIILRDDTLLRMVPKALHGLIGRRMRAPDTGEKA